MPLICGSASPFTLELKRMPLTTKFKKGGDLVSIRGVL